MSFGQKMKLNEAGVTLIDCDHKTPAAQASGYPYVGIPQLKDGHIRLDGARLISEEDFVLWTKKAKPQLNDVILSRRCNPGESAYVPESLEIALGQNLVLLRSDGSVIYPPFLRWLVQGNEWWEQVNKFLNVGAVFNSLKCKDIPNFKLTIPSLKEQKRITDILSSLDKKIELNNKINQTLESIAQALFKSWFIDFEPVRAKIAAKQNGADPELAAMCAISGKSKTELEQMASDDFAELQATAALFPDELVESELGEVPKGWEVTAFGDIAELCKGTINPQSQKDVLFNHYSLPAYDNSKLPFLEKGESIKSNKTLVPDDTVLISKLNPRIPRIWYIGTVDENAICSTEFIVFRPLKNLSSSFIYCYATSLKFLESLQQLVTGTSNSHQRVKPEQIKTICEIASNNDLRIHFSKMMDSIFLEILKNRKESENLAELRDSLLPKLLSGELDMLGLQGEGA